MTFTTADSLLEGLPQVFRRLLLEGQVTRGRTDLEHLFMADVHSAGFRAPGLAHVPDARARNRDDPCVAGFAVVGGNRRGALEELAIGVDAGWTLEDDVAARQPAHVEPPIVRPGHAEAQIIVVGIGPTDEDLPPPRQCVGEQADLLSVRL